MSLLSVSSVHFKSVRLAVRRVAGITGAKGLYACHEDLGAKCVVQT